MWCECFMLVVDALQEFREREKPLERSQLFAALSEARRDPVLIRPRPPIVADLGTGMMFALGKASISDGGAGPEELARRLLPILDAKAQGYFQFSVARGGYVNIDFTDAGREAFLDAFESADPSKRRSSASLLPWDLHGREPFIHGNPPAFDWNAVRSRAVELGDEDVPALLDRGMGVEVAMMLLGRLADPELDLRRYLNGMNGKENLPWLFERFRKDVTTASRSVNATESAAAVPITDAFLRFASKELPWFRFHFGLAVREDRPEALFGYLLSLVRQFYSFYSRPDFRNALASGFAESGASRLQRRIDLLELTVQEGLAILGLSGEGPPGFGVG